MALLLASPAYTSGSAQDDGSAGPAPDPSSIPSPDEAAAVPEPQQGLPDTPAFRYFVLREQAFDAFNRGAFTEAVTLATEALALAEREFGVEDDKRIDATEQLGVLFSNVGRYAEAEPLLLRALEIMERSTEERHPGIIPYQRSNLAQLYERQGRYSEAEALFTRALEESERVRRDRPWDRDAAVRTLQAMNALAFMYSNQGRYSQAEPLLLRALEEGRDVMQDGDLRRLEFVLNLGGVYFRQGRYPEAEPLLREALAGIEQRRGTEDLMTLLAANSLALLYQAQGRHAEAEPMLARRLAILERLLPPESRDIIGAANNLADLYRQQGRFADSEPLFLRAIGSSERLVGADHVLTANIAANLALLRLASPAAAPTALGPARQYIASVRARRLGDPLQMSGDEQRSRAQGFRASGFSLLADADWAAAQARPADREAFTAEAFVALQESAIGPAGRAVVQMAVRRLADESGVALGALVRERDELNSRWAVNSANYSAALSSFDPSARRLGPGLRAERARLDQRMAAIDTVLRDDFPRYFALVSPEPLDIAAAQALLAPDEAILLVVPTEFGTHVVGFSRTRMEWVRSDRTRSEVNGAVGQLLGNIRVAMGGGRFSYDRQTAYALYRDIVAPVASVLEGKRHLFIVAAGSLTSLPFGVLVTEEPQGADNDLQDLRTTSWFADTHALIQIPSIQALQFLRRFGGSQRQPEASGSSFVGFGNPVLDGPIDPAARERCGRGRGPTDITPAMIASPDRTRTGAMLADVAAIRLLCPIAGTAVELENMRTAFQAPPTALFVAENSTEPRLRNMDLSHVRILALATHGVLAGELPGATEPGLVFTPPAVATEHDDGYLTASEVSALNLDADWVILSACDTAAGNGTAGAPGLSSLASAFFYAGARNLLASHWPVADDASARLTVRTIELMRENPNFSRAEALQGAMREVREDPDPDHEAWAHPGVWAPFSLIGDGAN